MLANTPNNIITSIDVGTTKICVLMGRVLAGTQVEIIGYAKTPSEGLRKGVVVDIAKTIYAINNAVKEAELMAGCPITGILVGISGGHINSLNSHGIVPVKKNSIRVSDIENVLAAAQAVPILEGQQILHVLPQYFVIDGRDIVYDPLGMHGVRLEVEAHIITGSIASVQNLISCCQKADVRVDDIILEQIASSDAVLSDDERMLGVAMLDIGGGTADLAIYHQGSIRHTMVLPVAGNHFTNDVAVGLRTTRAEAERIKKEYGAVVHRLVANDCYVEIEAVQGKDKQMVRQHDLVDILRPRATELFTIIKKEIVTRKLTGYMSTGLVLTGGGSLLNGMQELAQEIFKIPVRIGRPHVSFDLPETLQNPIYATGYGMLIHALKKQRKEGKKSTVTVTAGRILERMKSWVVDLF
jgi:cell division protein FtsA